MTFHKCSMQLASAGSCHGDEFVSFVAAPFGLFEDGADAACAHLW